MWTLSTPSDPARPDARRIDEVRGEADLDGVAIGRAGRAGVGTGGMVTKVEAARIATGAGVPVLLTSAALAGAGPGRASPSARCSTGSASRRRPGCSGSPTPPPPAAGCTSTTVRCAPWSAGGPRCSPAGITGVDGQFTAGDPVDLVDPAGRPVARGLVNYDAGELPGLLGRSTGDLAAELGPGYEKEVVHRDDLVLLARTEHP